MKTGIKPNGHVSVKHYKDNDSMKDILQKVNHNDGMTVPEGYFEDFAARMTTMLPTRDWEEQEGKVLPKSIWQKIRPYVYMAAMFMGVWCMMHMFTLMRTDSDGLHFDNNPVITAAIGNDYFFKDYIINEGELHEYDLMDDLYETGVSPVEYTDFDDDYSSIVEI